MIKIGIIGATDRGKLHLTTLKKINEFEIVGIFDSDQNRVNQLAKEFNIKPFNSAEKLIESVSAVDFVSSNRVYFPELARAIKSGKKICIETTRKYTRQETEVLIKLSHEAQMPVQVNNCQRYSLTYKEIESHLQNPMILVATRYIKYVQKDSGPELVGELLATDIDIVLKSVKSNLRKVGATGLAVFDETPDLINARLEFDNGSVANITAGRISPEDSHILSFYQNNAYLEIDFTNQVSKINRKGTKKICFGQPSMKNTDILSLKLQSFYDFIKHNQAPICTLEDEHTALVVAEKISDKMKLTTNQI